MKFTILSIICLVLVCTQIYCIQIERSHNKRRFFMNHRKERSFSKVKSHWWWLNQRINEWSDLDISIKELLPEGKEGPKASIKGKMSFAPHGLVLNYGGEDTKVKDLKNSNEEPIPSFDEHCLIGAYTKYLIDFLLIENCEFKEGKKAGQYSFTTISKQILNKEGKGIRPPNKFEVSVGSPANGGWGIVDWVHNTFYNDQDTLINIKKNCDARVESIKQKMKQLSDIVAPYVEIHKAYQGSKKMLYQSRRDFFGQFYPVFEKQTATENIDLDDIEGLVQTDRICNELGNVRMQVPKGSSESTSFELKTGKDMIYTVSQGEGLPLCAGKGEKIIQRFFKDPLKAIKAKGTEFAIGVAKKIGAKLARMSAEGLSEAEPGHGRRFKIKRNKHQKISHKKSHHRKPKGKKHE